MHNTGFSDLGRGFYLTDDKAVAQARAASRARKEDAGAGVVSEYEFDFAAVKWVTWGAASHVSEGAVFGLRFADDEGGIAAWANYIKSCRKGHAGVVGMGEPAVVKAWIATEDVEMVCAGFAPAEALAEFIDPAQLVVQFCFRNQALVDARLRFINAIHVACS